MELEAVHAKDVHRQLLRTFKFKGKKGYCWLLSKFGTTKLEEVSDEVRVQMLECLSSKEFVVICPVHHRIHEGSKKGS